MSVPPWLCWSCARTVPRQGLGSRRWQGCVGEGGGTSPAAPQGGSWPVLCTRCPQEDLCSSNQPTSPLGSCLSWQERLNRKRNPRMGCRDTLGKGVISSACQLGDFAASVPSSAPGVLFFISFCSAQQLVQRAGAGEVPAILLPSLLFLPQEIQPELLPGQTPKS